ncbi:CapA family protein [Metabacillus herbersteinensis]|uniref:CapA family protein n=1 Tax=Metabacillus herbersteinensis TaxID=283816 RepID=A0ABV6GKR8_9BACI
MKRVLLPLTFLLFIALFLFLAFGQATPPQEKVIGTTHAPKLLYNNSYKKFQTTASFSAVGDILLHSYVYKDAKTNEGSYNFSPMFSDVKDRMSSADLTFANQETMIGGTELGLSTYPSFNSPYEAADALKSAGVDIVGIANNHTLDRGEAAILNATNYYDKIKLPYVGSYKSQKDQETVRVLNVNGIRVGFLAYTYGTNGIPIPEGKNHFVNLIDMEKMKQDIKVIKKSSDVIAVSMHWGTEYQRQPNEQQKELAQFLADEGVHLVIGHHPHVLQPMEWRKGKNGNETFVIYSLGNFLSAQEKDYKDIGGIFNLQITKKLDGEKTEILLHDPSFSPTIVLNKQKSEYQIKLLNTVNKQQNTEIEKHMFQYLNKKENEN